MNKAAYTWTKVAVIAERERKLKDKQNTKVTDTESKRTYKGSMSNLENSVNLKIKNAQENWYIKKEIF